MLAVICHCSHINEEEPCKEYGLRHKHARYDESFKGSDYDFVALVFETSGAVNDEGLRVLKQILRCASKRSGMGHSSYSSRAWARISCCLQISVAQMILNRDAAIHDFVEEEAKREGFWFLVVFFFSKKKKKKKGKKNLPPVCAPPPGGWDFGKGDRR